jgi:hypothetical protein
MTFEVALEVEAVAAHAARARSVGAQSTGETSVDLLAYADALDEIASGVAFLDRHDLEVRHQLGWWATRVEELERDLAGSADSDPIIVRELALFRGRISGAQAMVRHYQAERDALGALLVAANDRYGPLLEAE